MRQLIKYLLNQIQKEKFLLLKKFNNNEISGRYFPFVPGIGIQKIIESFGFKAIFKSPHFISISKPNDIILQINLSIFKVYKIKINYINI